MGRNAALSKDLANSVLSSVPSTVALVRFLFVNTHAHAGEGDAGGGGEERRRIARGGCLKTGSEHKGNRTLAYAWPFCSPAGTAVRRSRKHRNPSRLERVVPLSLSLSPLLHRCTREPAKSPLIICRVLPDSIYPHRSRITAPREAAVYVERRDDVSPDGAGCALETRGGVEGRSGASRARSSGSASLESSWDDSERGMHFNAHFTPLKDSIARYLSLLL